MRRAFWLLVLAGCGGQSVFVSPATEVYRVGAWDVVVSRFSGEGVLFRLGSVSVGADLAPPFGVLLWRGPGGLSTEGKRWHLELYTAGGTLPSRVNFPAGGAVLSPMPLTVRGWDGEVVRTPIVLEALDAGLQELWVFVDGQLEAVLEAPFRWTLDPARYLTGTHHILFLGWTNSVALWDAVIPTQRPPSPQVPLLQPSDRQLVEDEAVLRLEAADSWRGFAVALDGDLLFADFREPFVYVLRFTDQPDGVHLVELTLEGADRRLALAVRLDSRNGNPPYVQDQVFTLGPPEWTAEGLRIPLSYADPQTVHSVRVYEGDGVLRAVREDWGAPQEILVSSAGTELVVRVRTWDGRFAFRGVTLPGGPMG